MKQSTKREVPTFRYKPLPKPKTVPRPVHANQMAVPGNNNPNRERVDRNKAAAKIPLTDEQLALSMPMDLYLYPIDVQKSVVAILACCGTPLHILALYLRMSVETLTEAFGETLINARNIANSRVAGSLFNTALYGDDPRSKVTAAIFWLKAQARWREDGSTPTEKVETQNVIPLNSLTPSQFARIKSIVSEASTADRKAAENEVKLPDAPAPKKKGARKNGKA